MWPNNSIFGGRKNDEYGLAAESEGLNIIKPYDAAVKDIATLDPSPPTFDRAYVDEGLAGTSTWMYPKAAKYLRLVDAKRVFHGEELFRFWQEAATKGIRCADFQWKGYSFQTKTYSRDVTERRCAFARTVAANLEDVEYCTFHEDIASGIPDAVICTQTASARDGKHKVFAARFPVTDYSGGASAGEFSCVVPSASRHKVVAAIERFVKAFIGKTSKYYAAADPDDADWLRYKAEGVGIPDNDEKMFLRAYIFGSITSEFGSIVGGKLRRKRATQFSMNVDLTVSAQASDRIIDYRQPSEAMIDRMRNRFEKNVGKMVKVLSKDAYCKMQPEWD